MVRIQLTNNTSNKNPIASKIILVDNYDALIKQASAKFRIPPAKLRLFVAKQTIDAPLGTELRNNGDFIKLLSDVINNPIEVEIKPSTVENAGEGLFTKTKINKGDVVLCCPDAINPGSSHISKKINDLAYNGNLTLYENDEHVLKHINLGYKIYCSPKYRMFGIGNEFIVYMYALKDIEIGEELSRYYGTNFWSQK